MSRERERRERERERERERRERERERRERERERENTNSRTRIVYCTSAIGHYTNKGVGVGGVGGGGGHGIKQGKRINKRVGGGGSFAHTENYQFWYNCSVTHSYTYYQEIVFFCLWHEK